MKVSINLMRLKSFEWAFNGRPCVVIPIEANDLHTTKDHMGKVTNAYLNMMAWERKEVGKDGDTHFLKQSHSRAYRDAKGDEELRKEPILGDIRPVQPVQPQQPQAQPQQPQQAYPEDWDSFPPQPASGQPELPY